MKKLLLMAIFVTLSHGIMAQQLIVKDKVKFLALGDSYTIGESVPQNARWPVQLVDSIRKHGLTAFDAKIIATTGWRTDQLKSAVKNANLSKDYSLVSVLIGVNNQYQGLTAESHAPEFEELLNMAIELANGVKSNVFVVSIPDYGYTPFGKSNQPSISAGIDAFNAVNKSISDKLGIKYFNITEISRRGLNEPELVAGDGLHPSGKMYTEWVKLILQGTTIENVPGDGDGGGENPGEVTGINDERVGLNVYPNPFKNKLSIHNLLYLEQPVEIRLIDQHGAVAFHETFMQVDHVELNVAHLAPGIYHYQIGLAKGKLLKN
jgi:lysophospholipase L1-like esterase